MAMQNEHYCKVIGDIGGTNARFAMLNMEGGIQDQTVLKGADYPDFLSAFQEFLRLVDHPPITDKMTLKPWQCLYLF